MTAQVATASSGWTPRLTLALATLCLAQLIESVDATIVNVALPSIGGDLSLQDSSLQWVVTAYTLPFAGLLLLGGRAGDLLGHRKVFMAGVVLFTLASAAAGAAPGGATLLAARAVQGAAAGFVAPMTLGLIATTFRSPQARSRAFAIWGAVTGISASLGVIAGGVLTDALGWRWIFYINVPVGVLIVVLAGRYLPAPTQPPSWRGFDAVGATAVTTGLLLSVYGLTGVVDAGWLSGRTLGTLGLGLGLLGWFGAHEAWVAKAPLIPSGLFRNRGLIAANAVAAIIGSSMLGLFFLMSLYAQQVLGLTSMETGFAYVPLTLTLMGGAMCGPTMVSRIGVRWTLALGCAVAAVGMAAMGLARPEVGVWWALIVPSLLVGPGLALTFVPMTMAAVADVDESTAGVASAIVNTTRTAGGAVGLAVVATVVTATASHAAAPAGSREALASGFDLGFAVVAGLAAAAGLAAVVLFPRARQAPKGRLADRVVGPERSG